MEGLTKRQAEVLATVRAWIQKHGHPPTHKEIADACGMLSHSGAKDCLNVLQKKGYVKLKPFEVRGIELLSGP